MRTRPREVALVLATLALALVHVRCSSDPAADPTSTLDAGDGDATTGADAANTADASDSSTADAAADAGPPFRPGLDGNRGGARLKARYDRVEVGDAAIFNAIYDTTINATCTYSKLVDGSLRCLPAALETSDDSLYYDGTCMQPPVYGSTAGIAKYLKVTVGDPTCDARARIFSIGAATAVPADPRKLVNGNCVPATAPASATAITELGAATFASATVTVGPTTNGLAPRTYAGVEEPSRFFAGWDDVAGGFPCAFTLANVTEHRCLPTNAVAKSATFFFADGACSAPAAAQRACQAPFVTFPTKFCVGTDTSVDALGAPIATAYQNTGMCAEAPKTPGITYRPSLGAAPPATFIGATEDKVGAQRIQVRYDKVGTELVRALAFFDTNGAFDCKPALFDDGTSRCAPTSAGGVAAGRFADIACTVPVLFTNSGAGSTCGGQPVPQFAFAYGATGIAEVYAVAAGGGSYAKNGVGDCVGVPPPPKAVAHAVVLPALTPAAFAKMTTELR